MKRLLEIVLNAEGVFGGEQQHVAQILSGLDPDRYKADVVTWDCPQFVSYLAQNNIETLTVGGKRLLDRQLVQRLVDFMTERQYDLVHAHSHRAGVIGRLAAVKSAVPAIVWTCHGTQNKADANPLIAPIYTRVLRWLGRRTDTHVAVSDFMRDWLIGRGIPSDGIVVIPNGIDLDKFRPRPPRPDVLESFGLNKTPRPPVVGAVSRLTPAKGLETLLSAARAVVESRPDVEFVIVGGGPLLRDLQQQSRSLGIEGKVVFAGERDDVADAIATFDVAVLPSHSEGFGYAKIELMACAKPLICSDIEVFRDVVTDGKTGLLFPTGSAPHLAQAILRLLADPMEARRLAQAGHDLARREFALPVMQQRTTDLYDRILARREGL